MIYIRLIQQYFTHQLVLIRLFGNFVPKSGVCNVMYVLLECITVCHMKLFSEIDSEEGLAATLEAIAHLPPTNKDTLAYLILHLQKWAT